MQATLDLSVVFSNHINCDLQVICGPRYNTFGPAKATREEAIKFFQRCGTSPLAKRFSEDDADRWEFE